MDNPKLIIGDFSDLPAVENENLPTTDDFTHRDYPYDFADSDEVLSSDVGDCPCSRRKAFVNAAHPIDGIGPFTSELGQHREGSQTASLADAVQYFTVRTASVLFMLMLISLIIFYQNRKSKKYNQDTTTSNDKLKEDPEDPDHTPLKEINRQGTDVV